MEKTLPRQFFDRIYGGESSTTASMDTSHHAERLHHSSSNSSSEMQMHFGGTASSSVPIKTSPYMNGFASFCKYSTYTTILNTCPGCSYSLGVGVK